MAPSPIVAYVTPFVAQRDWNRVRAVLSEADHEDELDATALEILAEAAWWLGLVNESIEARRRALAVHQRNDDSISAARVALLLSEDHRRQGRGVIAESWRRRAARLLDNQPESTELGYLHLYNGEVARRNGDLIKAGALLAEAEEIAQRTASRELAADVAQEVGRVMIMNGAHAEGLALMDEAMLSATEGGLSPYTTGKIYCCLMSACDDLGDIQRAGEWERASSAWSTTEGVNVFPGMCRVHQADLLAHFGHWSEAERQAERACEELREVGWVVAYAYNTIGQLRCRRGDLDGAARAFTRAEGLGMSPEAGLSLLLLARGDAVGALRRITRALAATTSPPLARARLLPAQVQIAVAVGELDAASAAVVELEEIAGTYGTLKLRAAASLARSRVCLAAGDWSSGCAGVTTALQQWQELNAPYETAVARVLHARACRALDDHDGWAMSLDIAIRIFGDLGAVADLADAVAIRGQSRHTTPPAPGGLSAREVDVLRLVATGATNRVIAAELIVSEKTVARHLSNIFTKLGVSTRAAATAYAYQHHMVDGTP